MIFTLELQFFVTKGDRIYYDQIDDQTLRRPDGRPDHSGDQIDDQIPTPTKMWKLGSPSGRL